MQCRVFNPGVPFVVTNGAPGLKTRQQPWRGYIFFISTNIWLSYLQFKRLWLAWLIWNWFLRTNVFNLVVLIKLCKIWYLNEGRPLLFPRKQAFCLKNWKLWPAPTTTEFNTCCWNCTHFFYSVMSTKGCVGLFYFV